jgi:hypothetical protein
MGLFQGRRVSKEPIQRLAFLGAKFGPRLAKQPQRALERRILNRRQLALKPLELLLAQAVGTASMC